MGLCCAATLEHNLCNPCSECSTERIVDRLQLEEGGKSVKIGHTRLLRVNTTEITCEEVFHESSMTLEPGSGTEQKKSMMKAFNFGNQKKEAKEQRVETTNVQVLKDQTEQHELEEERQSRQLPNATGLDAYEDEANPLGDHDRKGTMALAAAMLVQEYRLNCYREPDYALAAKLKYFHYSEKPFFSENLNYKRFSFLDVETGSLRYFSTSPTNMRSEARKKLNLLKLEVLKMISEKHFLK